MIRGFRKNVAVYLLPGKTIPLPSLHLSLFTLTSGIVFKLYIISRMLVRYGNLFRGKLVYAPNTTAFNQVVQKVNETFQELQKVQNASQIWLDTISPNVMEVLQVLEVALNNATEMVNKTCSHLLLPDNACNKTLETLIKASETVYKYNKLFKTYQ